jgi:phage shock protein A
MGIFTRIGDVMRSNINDLIDRAEDPEKMVKQIVIDMQKELSKSTQALGKAMAAERIAEKNYKATLKQSETLESQAKAALTSGKPDAAKTILAQKVKVDTDVENYKQMYETIATQTDAIEDQVTTLKAKLEEAKSRQAMLIARSQMAETQKNLAKTVGTIDASSSINKFSRMEEKIVQKEAEAQAFSQISGFGDNAETDEFERIEKDVKVDAELNRLMAEMGMLPTVEDTAPEIIPPAPLPELPELPEV